MFNLIYSEFLKLRRTHIIPLIVLGAILIPFIQCFTIAAICNACPDESLKMQTLKNSLMNINLIQIPAVNTLIISLVASFIFIKEFTNKTNNVIYSYHISRMKIFIAKYITIFILCSILYLINFIAIVLVIYIGYGIEGLNRIFIMQLEVNLSSLLLQIFEIPIVIFIASVSKNLIIPSVYSIISAFSGFLIFNSGIYMQLIPTMLPSIPVSRILQGDPIDYIAVIITAVSTFVLFLFLCTWYWKKVDIQ